MTTPDYCEVTWSPTRAAAIVRMTVDEIPFDECDEAAHQLLACGNLARRINTPPAPLGRPRDDGYVSVTDPEPVTLPAGEDHRCPTCRDTGVVTDTPGRPENGPVPCPDCGMTPEDADPTDPEPEECDGCGHIRERHREGGPCNGRFGIVCGCLGFVASS